VSDPDDTPADQRGSLRKDEQKAQGTVATEGVRARHFSHLPHFSPFLSQVFKAKHNTGTMPAVDAKQEHSIFGNKV
jgi:hypothetical protein